MLFAGENLVKQFQLHLKGFAVLLYQNLYYSLQILPVLPYRE